MSRILWAVVVAAAFGGAVQAVAQMKPTQNERWNETLTYRLTNPITVTFTDPNNSNNAAPTDKQAPVKLNNGDRVKVTVVPKSGMAKVNFRAVEKGPTETRTFCNSNDFTAKDLSQDLRVVPGTEKKGDVSCP